MIKLAGGASLAEQPDPATAIIGVSVAIRRAVDIARRFAATHLPILLLGETGTGKELFAQEIHRWSGRPGELVDVNCGALPRDLVEGELFGHRRGAFTGAATETGGLIAQAHHGTLFLDELATLPLEGQVKLLRALETREVRRVGDTVKRLVDFRLIGAVQNGLATDVREGRFRIDLYQRLAGIVIELPPLLHRMEDVFPLASHFSAQHKRQLGPGVEAVLERHAWPGNIRELRTVIDRAVILSRSGPVDARALVEALDLGADSSSGSYRPSDLMTARVERERMKLVEAAEQHGWDPVRLARHMGVSRATLYRRLKRMGIALGSTSQSHESHQSHEEGETGETGETISTRPVSLKSERKIT